MQRRSREIPLEGHFGATLGSLWAYSDDFASLSDYFGIIVESLWVYAGRFSENIHFSNSILMILLKKWGSYGVALGSLWGHF